MGSVKTLGALYRRHQKRQRERRPKETKVKEKTGPRLTRSQVYEAACVLASLFSFEQLVMACWGADRKIFSLGSFDHPDSRKVWNTLYGPRGLIGMGKLKRVGNQLSVANRGEPCTTTTS